MSREVLPSVRLVGSGLGAGVVWLFTHAGHQGVGAHPGNEHKTCCPLLGLRDRKTAAIKQDRTGQDVSTQDVVHQGMQ